MDTAGKYCPNGYVGFYGSCYGQYQTNITVSRPSSSAAWGPATNAAAPFSFVLISRPAGPDTGSTDCLARPQQAYFTTSRSATDIDNQMLWKTRDIVLYSDKTQHALNLTYGAQIPW